MRYSVAAAALAGLAYAAPQAAKAPSSSPAASCQKTVPGSFSISVVNVTRKRDALEERQSGALTITLNNGVLKDAQGRTGEIVANRQFQFDPILQPDAIYTSGWAVCNNGSLVLGNQAVFYQCLSGDFYNLYDQSQGGQCGPIYIQTSMMGGSTSSSGSAAAQPDGQVTGSGVLSSSSAAVTQITDGQLQGATKQTMMTMMSISQIADGQLQVMPTPFVTQIGDGQIQAPVQTGRPVTQIGDGQIQATTARPSSSGRPVTQIGDGQIQATTARPSSSGRPVSAIGDGQLQASTARSNSSAVATAPATYTGAASNVRGELFGLAAGVLAVAML